MRKRLLNVIVAVGVFAGLAPLAACGPTGEEVAELRDQQRQILAKLSDLEKKIDQVAARPAAPAQQQVGPVAGKQYNLPVGNSPIRGKADAPVTIVEFSDYQCPFCARSEPIINDALKQYPEQLRFVYKHFPLTSIHSDAMGASKAAVAAQKQGKFWEMHDKIFANQRALKPENLKQYAQELGLDAAKFEADMNSPEVAKQVQEDMQLAQTVQVRGTPTIFVQGKLLQNRSVEGIKEIIDAETKPKSPG